jgi:hypothetical protein
VAARLWSRLKTENRKQKTENRKQKTENRKQKTENRKQKTENRKQLFLGEACYLATRLGCRCEQVKVIRRDIHASLR